jgi:hypothetical protein
VSGVPNYDMLACLHAGCAVLHVAQYHISCCPARDSLPPPAPAPAPASPVPQLEALEALNKGLTAELEEAQQQRQALQQERSALQQENVQLARQKAESAAAAVVAASASAVRRGPTSPPRLTAAPPCRAVALATLPAGPQAAHWQRPAAAAAGGQGGMRGRSRWAGGGGPGQCTAQHCIALHCIACGGHHSASSYPQQQLIAAVVLLHPPDGC